MNKYILNAASRTISGHSNKKLRRIGTVPATVFGKGVESLSIQVSLGEFSKIFKKAGETSVVWLNVEGENKERPTLIKSMTKSPVKGLVEHIDFHQVNLKEKVTANVPVELIGESELVKSGTAVLDQHLHEIEVEALPTEIPESIIFDISKLLVIGDHLKVSDVKLPAGVELLSDPESLVVALSEIQGEEEPLTPVVETEVAGAEKKEGEESKSTEPVKAE